MSANKSEIQSTKRKRVTNNAEVSDIKKKLITQGKTVKTKLEQKKGDSQQLNDGIQDSSQSGNNSWSREDQNKSINGLQDIKKQSQLKNKKNTVQSVNKKIPPIAELSADIILKIAEYPKKQELKSASLVDQICAMIDKFSTNYEKVDPQYFEQIKPKVEKLKRLFGEGIERGYAFQQQRIIDAANLTANRNKVNIITFHPTHIVTGQIMRQLVYGRIQDYSISFGHQGIAKTFAYYLYHQLSNMFISQIINCESSVAEAFYEQKSANLQFQKPEDQRMLDIPKLIYWTMVIQSEIDDEYLIKLFMRQCPQIQNQITLVNEENKKISFKKFVEQICQLYRTKGINVYLIVDQINKIASCFRKYFIAEQIIQKAKKTKSEKQINQLQSTLSYNHLRQKYQQANILNDFRHSLFSISEGFHCIFYNSSVNMETFFKLDEPSSKDAYNKIREQLKLYRQQDHAQRQSLPMRIFYPEIVKLDSSIWSLVDTIIFELKKLNKLSVSKQQMSALRKKIFDYLKEKNSSVVITFLRIAGAIRKCYLNQQIKVTAQNIQVALGAILEQVEKQEKDWLKGNLAKFKQKVVDPEERLEAIALIYDYMFEKQQTQQQTPKKKQKIGMKELSFLNCPISLRMSTKTFLLNNLDRHLFLFFENIKSFNGYFNQFKKMLKENLSSWLGNEYKSKQFQQLLKNIKPNNFSEEFGFSFLSPDSVIQLLKPEIRQLSQIKKENYTKILCKFTPSAFASVLEGQLVDYLKQTKQQTNFQLFRYTKMNQLKTLIQLPKKYAQKNVNIVQNTKKNKSFMQQFLIRNQKKQSDHYYYVPSTCTSKSIDFVIMNCFNSKQNQIHQIYLCQVTLLKGTSKMEEKIGVFLQAYDDVEKSFTQKDFEKYRKNSNKSVQLKIYFVVIGGSMNETQGLKNFIQIQNASVKEKYKFLKQIRSINFNQIKLPNCGEFFGAIRQIMEDKENDVPKQ